MNEPRFKVTIIDSSGYLYAAVVDHGDASVAGGAIAYDGTVTIPQPNGGSSHGTLIKIERVMDVADKDTFDSTQGQM